VETRRGYDERIADLREMVLGMVYFFVRTYVFRYFLFFFFSIFHLPVTKLTCSYFIFSRQQKLSLRLSSPTGLLQLCSLIVSRRTERFVSSQLPAAT